MSGKNPHPCLHCAVVDAIEAHRLAYHNHCHCIACVAEALEKIIQDVSTGFHTEDVPPSSATH